MVNNDFWKDVLNSWLCFITTCKDHPKDMSFQSKTIGKAVKIGLCVGTNDEIPRIS